MYLYYYYMNVYIWLMVYITRMYKYGMGSYQRKTTHCNVFFLFNHIYLMYYLLWQPVVVEFLFFFVFVASVFIGILHINVRYLEARLVGCFVYYKNTSQQQFTWVVYFIYIIRSHCENEPKTHKYIIYKNCIHVFFSTPGFWDGWMGCW